MYVITNRTVDARKKGLEVFGKTPNPNGPNELRLVRVTRKGNRYTTELLDDELKAGEVTALKDEFGLKAQEMELRHASFGVACDLMRQARQATKPKNILVYVHGYNNDMGDILRMAEKMEELYGVMVVPFSWPANGGGALGYAAYLSDKSDARASMDALNRFLGKLHDYHTLLLAPRQEALREQAQARHPEDHSRAQALFNELLAKDCRVKISLICHSMGNYLLKYALGPGTGASRKLIFDNVALVAADANNEAHAEWVERIQTRNRLYVVINEDDFALGWSRRKPGREQKARLGHYLRNLTASNAYYVDVTGAKDVGNSHSYFADKAAERNKQVQGFFQKVFNGSKAEQGLPYSADLNLYRLE